MLRQADTRLKHDVLFGVSHYLTITTTAREMLPSSAWPSILAEPILKTSPDPNACIQLLAGTERRIHVYPEDFEDMLDAYA